MNTCPALRPRWCPGSSPLRLLDFCLPLFQQSRLSLSFPWLSSVHNNHLFRGSITRPAPSLCPVSYLHYWFCTWISLLTCWLGFRQRDLSSAVKLDSHPLDNIDKFQGFCYSFAYLLLSQCLGLCLAQRKLKLKKEASIHSPYVQAGGEANEYVVELAEANPLKLNSRENVLKLNGIYILPTRLSILMRLT